MLLYKCHLLAAKKMHNTIPAAKYSSNNRIALLRSHPDTCTASQNRRTRDMALGRGGKIIIISILLLAVTILATG